MSNAEIQIFERYVWIKVGTKVDYHSIIGGPVTQDGMVVREPAQQLPGGGQWVCWLKGKAGCVSCESVTPHFKDQEAKA
jgi:hypothetical protein